MENNKPYLLKLKANGLDFFAPADSSEFTISMQGFVNAGFPSPASDYIELQIDLNKELVTNRDSTFFIRVNGPSMIDAGLHDRDVLVVDRSIKPQSGNIAVCFLDGEFTVKYLKIEDGQCWLVPANDEFEPIKVHYDSNFKIWGVVTYVIGKKI